MSLSMVARASIQPNTLDRSTLSAHTPFFSLRLSLTPTLLFTLEKIRRRPKNNQAQANGYAHEVRRRLGGRPPTARTRRAENHAEGGAETPVGRPSDDATAAMAAVPSSEDVEQPSSITPDARPEQGGPLGVPPPGARDVSAGHVPEASGINTLESSDESGQRRTGSGGSGRRGGDGSSVGDHRAGAVVFAALEASLRCCHGWLCVEAFRQAAARMGNGDGEGLPPSPRELTAAIALLHRFLSLLRVADGQLRQ